MRSVLGCAGALVLLLLLAAGAGASSVAGKSKCMPPQSEMLALRDFYEKLGGPSWRHSDGWLKKDSNPCGDESMDDCTFFIFFFLLPAFPVPGTW